MITFDKSAMKTLYIVRHAKSSWADPGQADFDRPLNDRGKKDAPRMGKRLKERSILPDLLLSSPAKRALSTCKKIAAAIGYAEGRIKTDKRLYHASSETLLDIVQNLSDKLNDVMIFGHNPGLTDFVNDVLDSSISNIPTCGVVAGRFTVNSWRDVENGAGELLFFDFPKSKDN